jgi:hypothetical protein
MIFLPLLMLVTSCDYEPAAVSEPMRLSLNAAVLKVADHIRKEKPGARLGKEFAIVDLTTDAIWDRLKAQVVKVKNGVVAQGESFVLREGKVLPIGQAFGGDGVTTVLVADLGAEKRPLLIYTFAWGSGVHRSEVAALDLTAGEPKELRLDPVNFSMQDYVLHKADNGAVEVLIGKTLVGHVTAVKDNGEFQPMIKLVEALPDEVSRALR